MVDSVALVPLQVLSTSVRQYVGTLVRRYVARPHVPTFLRSYVPNIFP